MNRFIKSIYIGKLFGYKDISIDFTEDCYILVGENGSGKTTVLNCMYSILSNRMDLLSNIRFDNIILTIMNNKKIEIHKYEVEAKLEKENGFSNTPFYRTIQRDLDTKQIKVLRDIIYSNEMMPQKKESEIISQLNKLGFRFKSSSSYIYKNIQKLVQEQLAEELDHKLEDLQSMIDFKLIFMPTYRRIESSMLNFESIAKRITRHYPFSDFNDIDFKSLIYEKENIQFGMRDVKSKINEITQLINKKTKDSFPVIMANLLTYLSSDDSKPKIDCNFDSSIINIILDRLGDQIKSEDKSRIRSYVSSRHLDNDNLNYLISRLINLYKEQEILDLSIKKFRDICNNYLYDKKFVYDESSVDLYLELSNNNERIDLEYLSSGEKQIVSLFSSICLDTESNFVVLFDEPELSLSVYWQENLLKDLLDTGKCNFLMAVTHSPYIYSKYLDDYAHAMFDIEI